MSAEPGARSLTGARWVMRPTDEQGGDRLRAALGLRAITARTLCCRGIRDPESARRFLDRDLSALADPFLMRDMDRAVALVSAALDGGAHIRVYGDYDVDGVCATALLVRALRALGGRVDWYIPHRLDEGYGVNEEAIRQAGADGVGLLITVDCGSTALGPVALARELGMEVVVTDHHQTGDELPDAPVLNPWRPDCSYPFKDLAGVGVAFKLLAAIAHSRGLPERSELRFLDLVSLGTVADVVPLLGENRLFVQHGLRRIPRTRKIGLLALLEAARIGGPELVARDLAFGLAPRINAAGRMEDARTAVELLLTRDQDEARTLAAHLCEQNRRRREEERQTLTEAEEFIAASVNLSQEKVIVLGSERWHPGVIGIVASRLVERYHRPVLLVALAEGEGKGSGRSIPALNLWEALSKCSQFLLRFGGHHFAAGFAIEPDKLPLLRERVNQIADEYLRADDLVRQIEVDAVGTLAEVELEAVRELDRLAPFGVGNPRPTLIARALCVEELNPVGDGTHVALRLRGESGPSVRGIWFRGAEFVRGLRAGATADVCFRPRLDEWNGYVSVQLHVQDIALPKER